MASSSNKLISLRNMIVYECDSFLEKMPLEIKTMIVQYIILPSQLQDICLVSKEFNEIATKFLYHNLALTPPLNEQPINSTFSYKNFMEKLKENRNLKWIRILSIHPCYYMSNRLEASLSCFIANIPDDCLERLETNIRQPLKDLTIAIIWNHQHRLQNFGLNSAKGSLLIEWAITGHKYLTQPMYLLELELCNISWSTMDELVSTTELPRVKFVKFVSCDDNLFDHPYLQFNCLNLAQITHFSVECTVMSSDFIIAFDMFPSLTHLALDQCSFIGPSLRAYKSPKLKDLRIRCYISASTKVEELENIRDLLSRFKGLELLALDPSWPTVTTRYRSAWLDILSEISNNHSGTLRGLVIRERRWNIENLETHRAMFTAAKRCKALRLLEIITTRESRIRNLTELLLELPQLEAFSTLPVPMSTGLPRATRVSMGTNLAEGMMHAAVARSKIFNLLSFTDTDLNMPSDRRIYLRHREMILPFSYDDNENDNDNDGQQQNAEVGGVSTVERNLEPGKWIPERTAKYYLHEYEFLQQPFMLRLQT